MGGVGQLDFRADLLLRTLAVFPVIVKGNAKQYANAEVDIDEIVCNDLSVHNDARRHVHCATPFRHPVILVIAHFRLIECAPT